MDYRPFECIKMVDADLTSVGLPTYTELKDALHALVLRTNEHSDEVEAADVQLSRISAKLAPRATDPDQPAANCACE